MALKIRHVALPALTEKLLMDLLSLRTDVGDLHNATRHKSDVARRIFYVNGMKQNQRNCGSS